ncbi:hypothetical protein C0992_012004 [Termitomyces sp. T32_za158]|nr:hypothetical protein C0992_012004 [Termitomyces sp. T32_za158]
MDVRIRDLFLCVLSIVHDNSFQAEQASAVTAEIVTCKKRILSIMEKGKVQKDEELLRMQYFMHTLQVFEAEFLTRAKMWDQIPKLVQEIVGSGPLALGTYEAVADILWVEKDCPISGG